MDEQDSPADVPAGRTRVGREFLWGGLAALVATLLAAWRVGAPGSLTGIWGHFDLTTAYAAARMLATHVLPSPNADPVPPPRAPGLAQTLGASPSAALSRSNTPSGRKPNIPATTLLGKVVPSLLSSRTLAL